MNTLFQKKYKAFAGMLVVLLCGSAYAQGESQGTKWERPNTDFSQYNKFIIKPLDINDVKVLKPSWEQNNPEEWAFRRGTPTAVQKIYMEIMSEELSKADGYQVVSEPGDGVLQLEVEFLSITPFVKPGAVWRKDEYAVTTLGSGTAVLSAELRDSVTGSLLILVEGERKIGTERKELSRDNHIANLKETFSIWGKQLRARLDEAHGT